MAKTLQMSFITAAGSKVSMNVPNPKDSITEEEVKTFMNLVKDKNIVETKGGDIIAIDSAKIVETSTTSLNVL
ncbi:DUF2922 domain-containing protein [Clostridium bornimense]|uniref:DUF2922 domain-containing protein n=1 Tax=Clostridium bornimense TaxID=1216932 RepID=UPI001C0FCF84|nr:DUF2922 domain-containing protein [Clostridium bornimense]MBU5317277.1 DUF2922 domain-containing protein [Clostridium bornimense]